MIVRRLFCAALTLAVMLSAPSTASAASSGKAHRTTVITATPTTQSPNIQVTVPSMGKVYINPLEIPVSINSTSTTEPIVSTPVSIGNQSNVPVRVDVSVIGKVHDGSKMSLSSSSTKRLTTTSKKAFIYLEMKPANSDDPSDVTWDTAYNSKKHIPVTSISRTKTNVITLAAGTSSGEVAEGGYGAFRLAGDVIKRPKIAWNDQDGLDVEVAFTFIPLPNGK